MEARPKPQGVIFVGSPKTYIRLIEQKERERERDEVAVGHSPITDLATILIDGNRTCSHCERPYSGCKRNKIASVRDTSSR